VCGTVAIPGIAQAQITVQQHSVSVDVQALVSIREAQLASTDSTGLAWTWTATVKGNSPFALQVQGPGRGSAAAIAARVAGGPWVRIPAENWQTVVEGPAGLHRLVVDLRFDDEKTTPAREPPTVRAVSR
jgi:hypothetical protein